MVKRTQIRTFLVSLEKWEDELFEMKVLFFSTLFLVFFDLKKKKQTKVNFKRLKNFLKEVYDYYCNIFEKPVLFERKGKLYVLHKDKNKYKIKEVDKKWVQLEEFLVH